MKRDCVAALGALIVVGMVPNLGWAGAYEDANTLFASGSAHESRKVLEAATGPLPADGKYLLGFEYVQGLGGKKRIDDGMSLIKEAADSDSPTAQYYLANSFFEGEKRYVGADRAWDYMRKAAASGHQDAEAFLRAHSVSAADPPGRSTDQAVASAVGQAAPAPIGKAVQKPPCGLAVDCVGAGHPSPVRTEGLVADSKPTSTSREAFPPWIGLAIAGVLVIFLVLGAAGAVSPSRRRPKGRAKEDGIDLHGKRAHQLTEATYRIQDSKGILAAIVFLATPWLVSAYFYSPSWWDEGFKNQPLDTLYLSSMIIVPLLACTMLMALYIKANIGGTVFDFDKGRLSFPGGGISANDIFDYIKPWFLLQNLRRFSILFREIRYISVRDERSFDEKGQANYKYLIDITGSFGAKTFSFYDMGKRDELYSAIVSTNRMGEPVVIQG